MKNIYISLTFLAALIGWEVANAQYCVPTHQREWGTFDEIELTNGTTNLKNTTSGWGGSTNGYTDYTIANVHEYVCIPGTTVGYKATRSTINRTTSSFSVWIDWDKSNTFEPQERMVNVYSNPAQWSGNFAVPATYNGKPTAGGTYRIRFSSNWGTSVSNPCQTNMTGGETEDYNFSVLYQENLALDEMLDPFVPSCSIGDSVHIRMLSNSKTAIDSAVIHWSKNDTMQPAYKWYGNISANTPSPSVDVNLGALNYKYGDTIKVWLALVNGDTLDDFQGDDTLMRIPRPGLKGTYSVGTPTSDYDSLWKVIRDIHEIGVCGNVIFNLSSREHYALCDFGVIPGITNNAEVTFNSMAGDADSASINWSSTSSNFNRVLGFDNTQNITFNDITIEDTSNSFNSRLVHMFESKNIHFNNCVFYARYSGTSSSSILVQSNPGFKPNLENISFEGCDFYGGYAGIQLDGTPTNPNMDITIEDCDFNEHYFYGVRLWDTEGLTLVNNTNYNSNRFPSTNGAFIYVDNVKGGTEIHDNSNITTERSMRYGIRIFNASGTPSNMVNLYNNRFSLGDTNLSTAYQGIYVSNSKFFMIAHNAIKILGRSTSSYGIYVDNGGANAVHNNIVANYGNGYAFNIQGTSSVSAMDNNALYAMNDFGRFGNQTIKTQADWRANYGFEINGVAVDPMFTDSTLRTCNSALDNIGNPLAQTDDIDGVLRSANTPDPGVFEYSAPAKFSVGDAYNICNGDTLEITAEISAADKVVWDNADTAKTMWFTAGGPHYAQLLGQCGNAMDTFDIIINKVVELPNDTNLCAGESLVVSADLTNGSYSWNTGSTGRSINIKNRGQYFVAVNDSDGCWSSDTIEVTVSIAAMLPNDTTICEGNTVDLNPGTGAGTYVWSNGSSSSRQFVDSTSTYWVQFTDPLNCTSTDTTRVEVAPLPFATFKQSNFSQSNWEFIADDQSGIDYKWSFGDGKVDSGLIWKTVNVYDTNGTFTVSLTVYSKHCGEATFTKEIEVITIGVNELANENGIKVFPNPTSGSVQIQIPSDIDVSTIDLKLVDLNGRVIIDESRSELNTIGLNLNEYNLASGVYQLSISSASNPLFNGKITLH